MGIISEQDQQAIRDLLDENLAGDVEIVMFTERPSPLIVPGRQPCEMCGPTEELLGEVASLSDKIKLTVNEIGSAAEEAAALGVSRVPAFVVRGAARGRMRFFGIPGGYEFSGFLSDLVDASKGESGLSKETREFLSTLTEDVHIQVFTTPS
jgi:alkyl hydroperoxide reductase subunit AhpF